MREHSKYGAGRILTFALSLSVGGAISSLASGAGKTLADCYAAALKRSEVVAISQDTLNQAEETYRQSIATVLPNLIGFGSYQIQQSNNNGIGSSISPSSQPLARLTVTQPLFQGFKEFGALRQTNRLIDAATYDRKQAETQLYLDTAASFYSILSAERDLENVVTEVALYEKRIKELKDFERVGRSRLSEVLTAETQKIQLAATGEQIKGLIRANREVLAFVTGFENTVELQNIYDLPPVAKDVKEYTERIDKRPDVQADSARNRATDAAITVARAGHYPTIAATGDYYLKRVGSLSAVSWDALITITVPIFSGGLIASQVSQAVSKRDQAESTLSRTKRLAMQQIRTFHSNYTFDRSQWETYREAREVSERNYKEQSREYKLGLVTNLDVLNALTTYQESQRAFDRLRFSTELDFDNVETASALRISAVEKTN